MPLLLLVPVIGAALWAGSAISSAGTSAGNFITGTPEQAATEPTVPSWVIPTVVIGVGALLLYKEGAKFLKL